MHILKPLDIAVALSIGINEKKQRLNITDKILASNSVSDLATSLCKAKGDISRAINRLLQLKLVGERKAKQGDDIAVNRRYYSLQRTAMTDFLCSGIRHVFGPAKLGVGRGMATGWHCPHLDSAMNPPETPLVWAMPGAHKGGSLVMASFF